MAQQLVCLSMWAFQEEKDLRLSSEHNRRLLKLSFNLTKHFLQLQYTLLAMRSLLFDSASAVQHTLFSYMFNFCIWQFSWETKFPASLSGICSSVQLNICILYVLVAYKSIPYQCVDDVVLCVLASITCTSTSDIFVRFSSPPLTQSFINMVGQVFINEGTSVSLKQKDA